MSSILPQRRVRRALVVAYVFPPSGGAGVQRVSKFVKYLPHFGWDCSVLTVSNPSVPLRDESLLAEIPEATVIRKARTFEPGYALKNAVSAGAQATTQHRGFKQRLKSLIRSAGNAVLQPDAQLLWYPQAVREGKRLLKELHHDVIFVTAPPFSSFLVGAALSRASGLPLVLDYRDEWGISNRYQENRQKSHFSHRWQERQQRSVLTQADAVIATTRRSADSLREVVQACGSRAVVSQIYNGFDASDVGRPVSADCVTGLLEQAVTRLKPGPESSAKFRIAYVGTLWNLTSIEPVVEALRKLSDQVPEVAARIELVLAGRRTAEQDAILDRLNESPCRVVRENYVEHARAIEIMQSANALCLLLSNVPEAERVMPAKTFEYLALQRPILAIAPRGEVTDLLSDCPYAATFAPHDVNSIAEHLALSVTLPDLAATSARSWNVQQFERRELTRQLAGLFNDVCDFPAETSGIGVMDQSEELPAVSACAPVWGGPGR